MLHHQLFIYPEENKIAVQEEKENEGQYREDGNCLTSYGPLINHIIKDDGEFRFNKYTYLA